MSDGFEGLGSTLRALREQEGEALGAAAELRAAAAPPTRFSNGERSRGPSSRINAVVREIEARQLH